MEFSEKLIALRKGRELTQEQLAEQLDVSRQSVSKWESGQAIPDVNNIIELSKAFDVSLDYLLKPSEIDELSVKTDLLEQRQKQLLDQTQRRAAICRNILFSIAIYLVVFAVAFVEHYFYFSLGWDLWGKPIVIAEFVLATAIVVIIWARGIRKVKNQ